jgi:hypothetical protein
MATNCFEAKKGKIRVSCEWQEDKPVLGQQGRRSRTATVPSAFALFHDQNFSPIDCNRDCDNQDKAEHHLLGKNIDADEGHSDPHDGDDQRAKHSSTDTASASRDRGSSNNNGGNCREQKLVGQRRGAATHATGEKYAGQSRETS